MKPKWGFDSLPPDYRKYKMVSNLDSALINRKWELRDHGKIPGEHEWWVYTSNGHPILTIRGQDEIYLRYLVRLHNMYRDEANSQ